MIDNEGKFMDNENYQKFIAELYSNSKFLDWTYDMSKLGGYLLGDDISVFRSDVANLLYRHHKRKEAERRRRNFYNTYDKCLRSECSNRREIPRRSAYKDYYCSKECYHIDGLNYAIVKTKDLVEGGVWDSFMLENIEEYEQEREEWLRKYEKIQESTSS